MIRIFTLVALALATPAAAGEVVAPSHMAAPACATVSDAALPPALSGWTGRTAVAAAAAADAAEAPAAALKIGRGADARLRRNGEVGFPVAPSRPGGAASYGGLLGLRVAQAGDYQVSVGSGAWIEMVADGRAVASTGHAPGPPCTTLKKTVVFPLAPGAYLLEVSGAATETLPVMVTRLQ